MASGTLKMWKAERGFGFILNDAGGPDMFLHITALQSAGIDPDSLSSGASRSIAPRRQRQPGSTPHDAVAIDLHL